jgi:hypothetical protein
LHPSPVRHPHLGYSPTCVDHFYTFRNNYPNGSFTLSVKELADDTHTVDYIDQLAARLGQKQQLDGIGQVAFWTTNGSLVTRNDNKVLLVDVDNLPGQFANPPQPVRAISQIIGTVVMGCWTSDYPCTTVKPRRPADLGWTSRPLGHDHRPCV